MDSLENYNSLLRLSCAKIVSGRHRRGGGSLHKNLLVLAVIGRVQTAKNKLEAANKQAIIVQMEEESRQRSGTATEVPEDDDDEDVNPPLEFSVTDSEGEVAGEVAFASEAVEEGSGSSDRDTYRKRKSDVRQPAALRSKSQRVIGERCVPKAY